MTVLEAIEMLQRYPKDYQLSAFCPEAGDYVPVLGFVQFGPTLECQTYVLGDVAEYK